MTFTNLTTATSTLRHGGSVRVEVFFHGYGLRLSTGRLVAARLGNGPLTFDTRAAAETGARSLRK